MDRFLLFCIFAFFAFVSISCAQPATEVFTGKAVSVTDGDTFTLLCDNEQYRIRLNGIDAPERHQPFGEKSKQLLSSLIFGKTVTVNQITIDRYDRIVGEVIGEGDLNVNQEMVRQGLAWWYTQYARNDRVLEALENEAREEKRGLWTDPNPTPPWDFRKEQRKKNSNK